MIKDRDKIAIIDRILEMVEEKKESNTLKVVGTLTVAQGIKGYKKAEIGTPVVEKVDRYIIVMETLGGRSSVEIPYYKESLAPVIKMHAVIEEVNQ